MELYAAVRLAVVDERLNHHEAGRLPLRNLMSAGIFTD